MVLFSFQKSKAQELHLKSRKVKAIGGREFAHRISDSTLTLEQRENIISKEIKKGNVPDFLRKLKKMEINCGWDTGEISFR